MLNREVAKKIHDAVDTIDQKPELLKYIARGKYLNPKFSGTYWENYYLVKSLNLGHRPTKVETDEVMFYSVAKLLGNGDADKGIEKFLSQFSGGL